MKQRLTVILAFVFLSIGMAVAQKEIKGVVLSQQNGEPVIGATVLVVGTSTGSVTDVDGKFSVLLPSGKSSMLRVSYIGMVTKDVEARDGMKIYLDDEENSLDEVMVVAYGTAKRSAFTGSAAEINSGDIEAHIASTGTSALAGKVAGVSSMSNSGEPGSAPIIRVRGIGSINASSAPLYIVDGAPYEADIASINPQDIESISVLKDASASAIYGARGANGVVIITTKKAKRGQDAVVKLDAKWGSNSRLVPQYDVISDPGQYYETQYKAMFNSIYYNGGSVSEAYAFADKNLLDRNNGGLGYLVYTVPEGEKLIGTNFKLNPNATLGYSDGTYYYTPDDWYDETFKSSFRQEYNLSVSGASDRLSYYASAGYLEDGGMVNNSAYKRYTARTNVDYQAKKWLKLTTNMGYTHTDSQTPSYDVDTWASSGNLFYICNTIGPIYPLYVRNADGSIMTDGGRTVYDANQTGFARPSIVGNAVRDNEYNRNKTFKDVFTGKWSAVATPVDGLSLTASLSATAINTRQNLLSSTFGSSSSVDGIASVEHTRTFAVNQQYLANYTKTFADVHNVTALFGYEQYKIKNQDLYGSNDHLFDPWVGELGNANGSSQKSLDSYTINYMTEGFLGRLQYDYANKYFFSGSFRRDASSVFAPGNRWGTFGSVGAAWQINKENFMKDAKWVDLLKLKVSYGEQGNDNLSSLKYPWFAYSDMYTTSYNEETGEYSITMSQKGNSDLTWETSRAWNIGVDFSLFNYRLNGTVEYYHRTTSDMLYFKTLPLSSGINVSSYPANIGTMVNQGIEVTLDGTIIKTKDLTWGMNLNFTHNKNKITKLDPSIAEEGLIYSDRIIKEGGSVYQAYMVKYAGTDKTNGKALYYMDQETPVLDADGNAVLDADGNAVTKTERVTTDDITLATQYDCGTTLPSLMGGFGTTLTAWGFDLSAQFSFQLGGQIYDGTYQALMHNGINAGSNMHKDLLDAWSPENPTSNIPRLSTASGDDAGFSSQTPYDRFLTSSDYLALNNLTLGYTFPKALVQKLQLAGVRVYVAGENLFLLTARKGLDPRFSDRGEVGLGSMTAGSSLASGGYSAMRTITAGITLSF